MASSRKLSLVAVIGEKEYADEITVWGDRISGELNQFAHTAASKLGLKSKYGETDSVSVKVYALEIKAGKLERRFLTNGVITLPQEPPTTEQYDAELASILEPLPEAFRGFVSHKAWEDGHSSGYVEVLNHARELTHDLIKCVAEFAKYLETKKK